MRKGLVYAEFPAPYRVAVFEAMAKYYELDVFYEYANTEERSKDYVIKGASFSFYFLPIMNNKNIFASKCKNLRKYDFVLDYNAGLKNGAILALAAKIQRIPYFINNDGGFVRHSFFKDILKRTLFSGASLCLAGGEVSREYFKAYGVKDEKIRIHNFTSLTEGDVLDHLPDQVEKNLIRRKFNIPLEKVIVIAVGQFIPRKGFDLLLRSWKDIITKGHTHLLLIGGGSNRAEYEAYIQENGIQDITIIDFLPKDTLIQYYQASDIFVLPTREDIWGLVINEAMSQGLPVISTQMCLAAKELVVPEVNGFLYEVKDTEKLTEYLNMLVSDETLRKAMGRRNIEKMEGQTMAAIGERHYKDIEKYFEVRRK